MNLRSILGRIRSDPGDALQAALAMTRGFLVRAWFLGNPNIRIGPGFRAYIFPHISGPGRVVIGANVAVRRGFLRRPCIITHSREATVTIGSRSDLGGTRISCANSVHIGEDALFACCTIIDSDVVPVGEMAADPDWIAGHSRPVVIGDRVWIAINAYVLAGAVVGSECVVSAGAVVMDPAAPERWILAGNPARRIRCIEESEAS